MLNNKEHFDMLVKACVFKKEDALPRIQKLVNRLIQALYTPTLNGSMFVVDQERLKQFGVEQEAINWGDLSCNEVKESKGGYIVIIDEASPDVCETFCEYIQTYMSNFGWKVEVITEW